MVAALRHIVHHRQVVGDKNRHACQHRLGACSDSLGVSGRSVLGVMVGFEHRHVAFHRNIWQRRFSTFIPFLSLLVAVPLPRQCWWYAAYGRSATIPHCPNIAQQLIVTD